MKNPINTWKVYVDGSSNSAGLGMKIDLMDQKGVVVEYAQCFKFPATNNEAKYEVLITGLRVAKELEMHDLKVYSNSQLIVKHIKDDYKARGENMTKYLQKVKDLASTFHNFEGMGLVLMDSAKHQLPSILI